MLCHQSEEVECYWFAPVLYSKATLFWLFFALNYLFDSCLQLLLSKVTYLWQYELIMCFAISRKKQSGTGLRSFCIP